MRYATESLSAMARPRAQHRVVEDGDTPLAGGFVPKMRVVAARFSERRQANAALDLLRRELHPPDVAIAPLARTDLFGASGLEPSADALLAGRFPDEQAHAAVELVQRAGGEVVADIDESWTGLNSASPRVTTGGGGHSMTSAGISRTQRFD